MKAITPGQETQASRLLEDALKQSVDTAVNQVVADGEVSHEGMQRFFGRGDHLKSKLIPFLKSVISELSQAVTSYLRCISEGKSITLDPTDGTETIADAKNTFVSIDPDFENYGTNVPGSKTEETKTAVYEMTANGEFKTIFGGFDVELDTLCLTQAQIIQFVEKHRKWLRADGYATFFLMKTNGQFFVARVGVYDDGRLKVHVHRFSHDRVCSGARRRRVVVPQLELEN